MSTVPTSGSQVCQSPSTPHTVVVEPVASEGTALPAEYRVLLYEQLVDAVKQSKQAGVVYRAGDIAASCAAVKLKLSVVGFKKGNEALRVSTGPVGLFVGTTSVKFEVTLANVDGKLLFEKSLKTSKHGDADSLNVTRDLAKDVSKRLVKAKQSSSQSS